MCFDRYEIHSHAFGDLIQPIFIISRCPSSHNLKTNEVPKKTKNCTHAFKQCEKTILKTIKIMIPVNYFRVFVKYFVIIKWQCPINKWHAVNNVPEGTNIGMCLTSGREKSCKCVISAEM